MKETWEALAVRTKAIILAVFALASIVTTVWVIDARYAKAGEFKSLQMSIYEERVTDQIKIIEERKGQTNCREEPDECEWFDQRIDYWQKQLKDLRGRK